MAAGRTRVGIVALLAASAALLCGCPPARHVSGAVYGGSTSTSGGDARVLTRPLYGATVSWTCPPSASGPPPQTLTTDFEGRFVSKEIYASLSNECELVVEKAGYATFRERIGKLCEQPGKDVCRSVRVAVELRKNAPEPRAAVPLDSAPPRLDAPPGAGTVFDVDVLADGRVLLAGKPADDDALFAAARAAHDANPDVRAVLRADKDVTHGRVVHVIDVLKQAQVAKIAFGVAPVPP